MQTIDTSTWKEFKIGDLFDSESGNVDIKKEHINGKGYPVVSSGVDNQGIIGCTDIESKIHKADTISVDMFGNVFYRDFEYKMVTHARVFALLPKGFEINKERGNFLVACISKITSTFEYNNMCSYKKIKDLCALLPATSDGQPDWAYMEERIAELEQERIAELEAYLVASGLDDYELSEEDKKVLAMEPEWGEFRMGDLFEKCNLKRIKKDFDKAKDISKEKTEEFNIPLINAKHGDNGIMYYGRKEDWETTILAIDIVNDGAVSTGDVYPQPEETGVLYNAYLIQSKEPIADEKLLFYLAACIERSIKGKFGYDKKASWDRVAEEYIKLPVLPDGTPDFDYMEKYIRAIEKLTVQGVVEWKDKEIEKTKEVVA